MSRRSAVFAEAGPSRAGNRGHLPPGRAQRNARHRVGVPARTPTREPKPERLPWTVCSAHRRCDVVMPRPSVWPSVPFLAATAARLTACAFASLLVRWGVMRVGLRGLEPLTSSLTENVRRQTARPRKSLTCIVGKKPTPGDLAFCDFVQYGCFIRAGQRARRLAVVSSCARGPSQKRGPSSTRPLTPLRPCIQRQSQEACQ
jgi:hypothetical protein